MRTSYCVIISFSANNVRDPIQITYIPSHLYHMLFELFKVSPYNDILKLKMYDGEDIACKTLVQ